MAWALHRVEKFLLRPSQGPHHFIMRWACRPRLWWERLRAELGQGPCPTSPWQQQKMPLLCSWERPAGLHTCRDTAWRELPLLPCRGRVASCASHDWIYILMHDTFEAIWMPTSLLCIWFWFCLEPAVLICILAFRPFVLTVLGWVYEQWLDEKAHLFFYAMKDNIGLSRKEGPGVLFLSWHMFSSLDDPHLGVAHVPCT